MEPKEKLRRFAHFFARHDLREHHYDNCKVEFSQAHAYGLAFEYLLKGYSSQQIEGAYYNAMIRLHQLAVDQGRSSVVPSGLISDARRRLERLKPANQKYDPNGVLSSGKRRVQFREGTKSFGNPKGHSA